MKNQDHEREHNSNARGKLFRSLINGLISYGEHAHDAGGNLSQNTELIKAEPSRKEINKEKHD